MAGKQKPAVETERKDLLYAKLDIFEQQVLELAADIMNRGDLAARELTHPGMTAAQYAHVYGAVRRSVDALFVAIGLESKEKTRTGSLLAALNYLKTTAVPAAFENEKIRSFTTTNGYRVTVSSNFYASIKADCKEDAYQWLRDHGLPDIIIETVNASTLSAAGRKLLEDQGIELPEDFFNAHYQDGTSMTKVK